MKKSHDQYWTFYKLIVQFLANLLHIHSLQFEILVTALVLLKDHL